MYVCVCMCVYECVCVYMCMCVCVSTADSPSSYPLTQFLQHLIVLLSLTIISKKQKYKVCS